MSIVAKGHAKVPPEGMSSTELVLTDQERILEIEHKHRLISKFLQSHGYDALLLEKPSNFSWFTAGASCCQFGTADPTAALFITPEARVIVTCNTDAQRLFDFEIPGAGFQLKQRPWHEPRHVLVEDLCRGRAVASDTGFGNSDDVSAHLVTMRLPLTARECQRLRELGRDLVHTVEATARQFKHRQSEAEIAGEVVHRMLKRNIAPVRVQVAGDDRSRRYRHWSYSHNPVERYCIISAIGTRFGLNLGVSRTVSFGEPADDVRNAHYRAMLIHATGMHFSQNQWQLAEVWKRVARIYEKFGYADEWEQAPLAEMVGYSAMELPVVPRSEFQLAAGIPIHWHPTVSAARAGDTILVGEHVTELLTPLENWPRLTVEVKGTRIDCPEILRRNVLARPAATIASDDSGDSVYDLDLHLEDGLDDAMLE